MGFLTRAMLRSSNTPSHARSATGKIPLPHSNRNRSRVTYCLRPSTAPKTVSAFLHKGEKSMNAINPIVSQAASAATGSSGSSTGLPNSQGLNNMFMQLLVAQLQNQSPLNPMDPTQFVGQLAQFSELSEVTQIEQTLQQIVPTSATGSGSGSGSEVSGSSTHATA